MEYRLVVVIVFLTIVALIECRPTAIDRRDLSYGTSPTSDSDDLDEVLNREVRSNLNYRHQNHRKHKNVNVDSGNDPITTLNEFDVDNEPTCEQLKFMWKQSQQAAIKSLTDNEISSTYGHFVESSDNTYGQINFQQPSKHIIHGVKSYRLNANRNPFSLRGRTAGSYDKVEEQLRDELFSNKGKFGHKNRAQTSRMTNDGHVDDEAIVYGTYKNTPELIINDRHRHRNKNSFSKLLGKWSDELIKGEEDTNLDIVS
ncbi:hypothetical protein CHUAL_008370 [Chamberlinius hualienensis]